MNQDEPQKPKPRTDGKQTAGHSYLTRSKLKLSHSDDDRTQAQEPPLKRQTKPGSKQVRKSVGMKNNNPTPELNVVDTNTVDEYAPAKVALQNDLVLETLLRYMNRSDLLSCRVMNKQWQYEATKELRRRKLVIRFYFQCQGNELSRAKVFQDICRHLSGCRTSSLLASFHVKTIGENVLGSAGVTRFFTTVGNQLKHLTLNLNSKRSTFINCSLKTDLQNLLFHQAPNLEFLEITFDFEPHWEAQLQTLDVNGQSNHNESLLLPNLKTFIVSGSPPQKFFGDVITAAVNLRSVGGVWSASSNTSFFFVTAERGCVSLDGFSSTCIKYFMGTEGKDKIHLLKSLRFQLAVDSCIQLNRVQIELMETFVTRHKQNLQLETFECVSKFLNQGASIAPRVAGVINQILECSSGSLKKLRIIEPAKWFKNLLIIPRLPKLQEICFDCEWSSLVGLRNGGGFFPRGFNMTNSFPNVSTIVLLRCSASFFRLFVSQMEVKITEPVPSVRRITMIDAEKGGSSVPPVASGLHHIFPNLVSVSYVDSEKFYKI